MAARAVLLPAREAPRGRCGGGHDVLHNACGQSGGRLSPAPRPPARPSARASPPPLRKTQRGFVSHCIADDSGASASDDAGSTQNDGTEDTLSVNLASLAPSAAKAVTLGESLGSSSDPSHDEDSPKSKNQIPFVPSPDLLIHCEPVGVGSNKPLKIACLLSGGVDSSVALTLLKAAGHDVTAFYLQIWFQEDFRNFWDECPWEDDLNAARGVCDVLDVPLKTVHLTKQYWDLVVSHSIDEIAKGRTPNPDMLCNSRVKFGAFREHLAEEYPEEFDRVASGHYAAMDRGRSGATASGAATSNSLILSGDLHKDQTYFLAHLSRDQLKHLSFPIGGLPKSELRAIASAADLPNANRKDSQGICFLGKVKFSEFVAGHLGELPGAIVELETGTRVGTHKGFWFHTIGQRSGLGLSGGPWYVASKDIEGNVVYVTTDYYGVDKPRNTFSVGEFNWISGEVPFADENGWVLGEVGDDGDDAANQIDRIHPPMVLPSGGVSDLAQQRAASSKLFVKVRHGENRYGCTLKLDSEKKKGTVVIDRDDQGLAAGQFAVFYDENECLGCGVILERPVAGYLIERDGEHRTVIEGGVCRVAEERRAANEKEGASV